MNDTDNQLISIFRVENALRLAAKALEELAESNQTPIEKTQIIHGLEVVITDQANTLARIAAGVDTTATLAR